jgi:hypothetical protein
MKHTDIETLADEAANEAIKYIQEKMNIPSGDFAGMYFDNRRWEVITQILVGYIVSEIMEGKSE